MQKSSQFDDRLSDSELGDVRYSKLGWNFSKKKNGKNKKSKTTKIGNKRWDCTQIAWSMTLSKCGPYYYLWGF